MAWPTPQDYSEAIQNPKIAFSEPDLRDGRPELDKLGLPRPRSGSFATVYKILSTPRNWAVKCFLTQVSDQQERYSEISAHLLKIDLPYLIQFKYLASGIRVAKQAYPIVKMEWVEGESLSSYIERCRGNPGAMLSLAKRWVDMTTALTRASIAHGDLQHGNVLIVNGELRLVDYDGMYVPSLMGKGSHERGQRNYQHPQRTEFDFGAYLDNFSSWVVYVSLVAIAVQPQLWQQFRGGDDCLLFRQQDFEHPKESAIFRALDNLPDDRVQSLARFFRSLLDLGPRDVPSLDGQVVPPPSSSAKPPSSSSWIDDYVRPPGEEQALADTKLPSVPVPQPSWIQDFMGPSPSTTPQRQFENSVVQERVVLGASLVFIAVTITLAVSGFIQLIDIGFALLVLSGLNFGIWTYRYRSDAAVVAMKTIADEMKTTEDKVRLIRAIIKSKDGDKKSLQERHSFEVGAVTKDIDAAGREEEKEINDVQTVFQSEMNSITARRRELTQREAAELQDISSTLGAQLGKLNRQIAELARIEASELSAMLANQQAQFVTNFLRSWHIDNASIQGIGPGFKSRLRMAGILTAADVDGSISNVKGFGQTRTGALLAWQQPLKARAQQQMPKALSGADASAINAKYTGQRQGLVIQREGLDRQVKDRENTVRMRYKSLREPLDKEELAVNGKMQSKKDAITAKYKERYSSLASIRRKLDENFGRNFAELEERSSKDRRSLFDVHWEQEKVRRRIIPFKKICFSGYLRRVVGIRGR